MNPLLADWFKSDPVEKIVHSEALLKKYYEDKLLEM